jgi:hypothetical protein
MYRNRKLLDIAHDAPCFLRVSSICRSGVNPSIPAHSNLGRHGRGYSYRSSDAAVVASCPECHYWLDAGPAPRHEKEMAFSEGLEKYLIWLLESGKVDVV